MGIALKKLKACKGLEKVVIESVDLSLYIATALVGDAEELVLGRDGKPLKTHNLLSMQRQLRAVTDAELVLRQRSAYDEMVGHSYAHTDNTMELSLGNQPLPEWLN